MPTLLNRMYFSAPIWMQNILISAYGARLRYLRDGKQQQQFLSTIRQVQWLPAEELARWQLSALNATLSHARKTVPFYKMRLPAGNLSALSDLQSLPIVTKDEVREAGGRMISSPFHARRLLEVHTGGTTGTPLTVYCTRTTLQRNYAFFARFREWIGIPHDARVATFAGRTMVAPDQMRPPYWRRNLAGNALLCSSYHISPDTIPEYVKALTSFAPAYIDAYPSSIEPIARYMRSHGISSVRPMAVITSSETLLPHIRRLIEEAFGCPVFDHYGAAEMTAFITQCRAGNYHPNPDFGVIEIVNNGKPVRPGETGEIVATGFVNPVMPFVRYATGDLAVQGEGRCSCGRAFPTIERVIGRMDDVLVTPEGRTVGRLDPIFKAVSSLVETRIVQDRRDHVRIETVTTSEMPQIEQSALVGELRNRLGPMMSIDVVRVPRIARTSSGKSRAVVKSARAE